jgi:hypothetical protein
MIVTDVPGHFNLSSRQKVLRDTAGTVSLRTLRAGCIHPAQGTAVSASLLVRRPTRFTPAPRTISITVATSANSSSGAPSTKRNTARTRGKHGSEPSVEFLRHFRRQSLGAVGKQHERNQQLGEHARCLLIGRPYAQPGPFLTQQNRVGRILGRVFQRGRPAH